MSLTALRVNLGGEGEIPGVLNQQGPWVFLPSWRSSRTGKTIYELLADGIPFIICPNIPLPFPDRTFDIVYTNGVPLDINTRFGPGVQSSEIVRILKPGGVWLKDTV
jgi:SAM-dependent methyltransferase